MPVGTIDTMVREAAEQCGWDDDAVIEVLQDFIAGHADIDEFADFLREQADGDLTRLENYGSKPLADHSMPLLAADIRAARIAAERILEEIGLGSYVFTIELKERGWELTVECAAGEAWQAVSLPVDPAELRRSADDPGVRSELRAAWGSYLKPCAKRGS